MFNFKDNFKDAFSNVLAIILVIAGAVQAYIGTIGEGTIDWYVLIITVVGAVVAWLTGKSRTGGVKPPVTPTQ